MQRSKALNQIATAVVLAAVYFVAGKLASLVANPDAGAVLWPCTGIGIAALLIFGYEVWPGILVGAFFASLTSLGAAATALGTAAVQTLEALTATYLVNRFARGKEVFERAKDVFKFAALVGLVSAVVNTALIAMNLALGGVARWEVFWAISWTGDAAGAVMVTPLLLLWWENPRPRWTRAQIAELNLLFLGLCVTGMIVFGGAFEAGLKSNAVEYLCVPFLIWAAFRFGRREAAAALCALTGIATWGTTHGFVPSARETHLASLVLLHFFMGILAVTVLALSAEVSERRRAEERAHSLAVSDPLTGLANYRQMVDALESEIRRFGRTERPFVVLLLDLDGLKKINDAHGHLTGSRALCRLADMLRLYSRDVDTAARYGGDEFVLILPETDAEAARLVAQRISKRLAEDGEEPKISVSIGMAVCPDDGETLHEILGAADRDLYREKGVPKKRFVLPS